ncbi:hypothetical protein KC207_11510 [Phycicoccus sp. BSK3Z-2]|uniref:Uncharacterized protein n=1 Tax=Phycicoccus avicenniae TaxID=2828860 RepID=A0A941HZC0_9MICO|nr:hypothetical protein [Phycicoccus avicenniae]MBR7743918.1 hypothetical protein [Phycicoccus avicenniae]
MTDIVAVDGTRIRPLPTRTAAVGRRVRLVALAVVTATTLVLAGVEPRLALLAAAGVVVAGVVLARAWHSYLAAGDQIDALFETLPPPSGQVHDPRSS